MPRKIGPHLIVEDGFKPNMQTAYEADNERGSHELNNQASAQLGRDWPTVIEMARLIEEERDALEAMVKEIKEKLTAIIPV